MAIMVVAFASILMIESGSLNSAERARQMSIVAMLAKTAMSEAEITVIGKTARTGRQNEMFIRSPTTEKT